MGEQAIETCCFIDNFFLSIGRKNDVHCRPSDAGLLTTALVAAFLNDHYRKRIETTLIGITGLFPKPIYAATPRKREN